MSRFIKPGNNRVLCRTPSFSSSSQSHSRDHTPSQSPPRHNSPPSYPLPPPSMASPNEMAMRGHRARLRKNDQVSSARCVMCVPGFVP